MKVWLFFVFSYTKHEEISCLELYIKKKIETWYSHMLTLFVDLLNFSTL